MPRIASSTSSASQAFAKTSINEALALLQARWALRILWELSSEDSTFRDLQARCGDISPSVMNQRLGELRSAALIETGSSGYTLTTLGKELVAALMPLSRWAVRWKKKTMASR